MTKFAGQVRIRLISQLIKGISRFFQKLLEYFNDTCISTFTVLALLVLFMNLDLDLNDSESVAVFFGSSLQNWYKLLMFLYN